MIRFFRPASVGVFSSMTSYFFFVFVPAVVFDFHHPVAYPMEISSVFAPRFEPAEDAHWSARFSARPRGLLVACTTGKRRLVTWLACTKPKVKHS